MKRIFFKIIPVVLVCFLLITGCTAPITDEQKDNVQNQELNNNENTNEEKETNITEKGTYVGQIDTTSIEIDIDGQPKSFTSYEMDKLLQGLNDGDEVMVTYTKNDKGQLMIKELKKVE